MAEPSFVDRDPAAIVQEMMADWELQAGKTLQPAQWERLLINLMAYREWLVRVAIQETGKQCLVNFATGAALEQLGALVGIARLSPVAALCTHEFTLAAAQAFDVAIPAGTQILAKDGVSVFATLDDAEVPAGELSVTALTQATTAGAAGNGFLPGEIATLMAPLAFVDSAVNITESLGGSEAESDERLRERIKLAPEAFSVAGSREAYRLHALGAHPDLVDVGVQSASPGTVQVYPLLKTGLPTAEVITQVNAAVSGEKVRPLTDTVAVLAPTEVPYVITASVMFYRTADQAVALEEIEAVLAAYAADRRAGLGRDVVPSQITQRIQAVPGVYQVTLASPALITVSPSQWANCTNITVAGAGVADG